jgi:hypothetical protein
MKIKDVNLTKTLRLAAWPLCALALWLLTVQSAHCYYNPTTGRWISRDPVAEKGGMNTSSFVANDPVAKVDLLGLTGSGAGCLCCECAVAMVVEEVITQEPHPIGHYPSSYFRIGIYLDYIQRAKGGRAKYEWWEYTDHPLAVYERQGVKPNRWYDAFLYPLVQVDGPVQPSPVPSQWRHRHTGCNPPMTRLILDEDQPGQKLTAPKRTLHIKPTVTNPPCCGKDYPAVVQLTIVQTVDPAANPVVSLSIPDPSPPPQ